MEWQPCLWFWVYMAVQLCCELHICGFALCIDVLDLCCELQICGLTLFSMQLINLSCVQAGCCISPTGCNFNYQSETVRIKLAGFNTIIVPLLQQDLFYWKNWCWCMQMYGCWWIFIICKHTVVYWFLIYANVYGRIIFYMKLFYLWRLTKWAGPIVNGLDITSAPKKGWPIEMIHDFLNGKFTDYIIMW